MVGQSPTPKKTAFVPLPAPTREVGELLPIRPKDLPPLFRESGIGKKIGKTRGCPRVPPRAASPFRAAIGEGNEREEREKTGQLRKAWSFFPLRNFLHLNKPLWGGGKNLQKIQKGGQAPPWMCVKFGADPESRFTAKNLAFERLSLPPALTSPADFVAVPTCASGLAAPQHFKRPLSPCEQHPESLACAGLTVALGPHDPPPPAPIWAGRWLALFLTQKAVVVLKHVGCECVCVCACARTRVRAPLTNLPM